MTNTFDTRGRQTGITYSGSHLSQTYVYSFSADTGLLASETINGKQVTYGYDALERLSTTEAANLYRRTLTYAAAPSGYEGTTTGLVSGRVAGTVLSDNIYGVLTH